MSNLTFIIGQIRSLESKLLNTNQIDRMVGAATPLDAFRVLIELEYADYIDETTTPDDFETIINQGLLETKRRLEEGTEHHKGLQFLWIPADLNNLKRAYKLRFLQNAQSLQDFSPDKGFSMLGTLSHDDLEQIVFHDAFPETLPDSLQSALSHIPQVWEEHHDILVLETTLDKYYFDYLERLSTRMNNLFIRKMYQLSVDALNIKSLSRCVLLRNTPLTHDLFVGGGTIDFAHIADIDSADMLSEYLTYSPFAGRIDLSPEHDVETTMLMIEQELEQIVNTFLDDGQAGEIDSIQVPLSYFNRRLRNAKMLKFIMFGKFHGLGQNDIYETLKTF